MTAAGQLADAYAGIRPLLLRVAYAVLGSHAEAEDVVSDCWLRLADADARQPIRDVQAWSTVAVSRRALDVLRSARVQRERYIGPWLPEPLVGDDPADQVTLDDTVSYALLVVLETLSPAERTSWVLHDLFGMQFSDVASVVGRTEAAVRQLASRARKHVADGTPRVGVSATEHQVTTRAFARACAQGDVDALLAILDPDVTLTSDGGGQVIAAKVPVHGATRVATFLVRVARRLEPGQRADLLWVNGAPGLVVRDGGRITTVVSLTLDESRITRVDLIRAPAKLQLCE